MILFKICCIRVPVSCYIWYVVLCLSITCVRSKPPTHKCHSFRSFRPSGRHLWHYDMVLWYSFQNWSGPFFPFIHITSMYACFISSYRIRLRYFSIIHIFWNLKSQNLTVFRVLYWSNDPIFLLFLQTIYGHLFHVGHYFWQLKCSHTLILCWSWSSGFYFLVSPWWNESTVYH